MGFDRRFTLGLIAWVGALVAVLLACIAAFVTPASARRGSSRSESPPRPLQGFGGT
ncbi:hypothetical protein PIB19_08840 [Sphingomonas sp. 7/4-4]|uniref:hypothetical protein n=1 Tax=Sphingomonas sp. 7/4-4 TaxID=3018446 RepID=UPI0022F3D65F|nr:hypothetical protein [Sphingomonas sp. 7/4-4]WBY09393.1 hypothetical protein PIB19_08840 [Sphingomonas sp. 7/4-4]